MGSGKSTVSALLAERGAHVVDADAVVRGLQEPGTAVFAAMAARFGPGIVAADGSLDRSAVAAIVFDDADALADLNAIVHPAVSAEIARRIRSHEGTDDVVIADIPLLIESTPELRSSGVVVVDVPEGVQVERLVRHRGFSEADARARIGRQATREQRRAMADRVIDNSGTLAALIGQVEELWAWIRALPDL